MCTASWLTVGDRFHFLFNRDERRARAAGLAPRALRAADVAYLSPIDPDAGGTWFAATERGLVLALLNRTVDGQPQAAGRRSRGSLIPELVGARDLTELATLLAALELADCAPFRLFADLPGSPALGAVWDGQHFLTQPITTSSGLLCSSSRGDHEVTRSRSRLWAERSRQRETGGIEELRSFHRSHLPSRSAASVCMHREDASTVSHLEVLRTADEIQVAYFAGSPCSADEPERSTLPLAVPAAGR